MKHKSSDDILKFIENHEKTSPWANVGILQSEIGRIFEISKSALSQRISLLLKKGLIIKVKKRNPHTGKQGYFLFLVKNEPKPIPKPKPKIQDQEPKPIPKPKPKIQDQEPKPIPKPKPKIQDQEPKPIPKPKPKIQDQEPKPIPKPKPKIQDQEPKPIQPQPQPQPQEIQPDMKYDVYGVLLGPFFPIKKQPFIPNKKRKPEEPKLEEPPEPEDSRPEETKGTTTNGSKTAASEQSMKNPYLGTDHYFHRGPEADILFDKLQINAASINYDPTTHERIKRQLKKYQFKLFQDETKDGKVRDNGYEKTFKNFHVRFSYNKKLQRMLWRFWFDSVLDITAMLEMIKHFLSKKIVLDLKNWHIERSNTSEFTLDWKIHDEDYKRNILKAVIDSNAFRDFRLFAKHVETGIENKIYEPEPGILRNEAKGKQAEKAVQAIPNAKKEYQKKEILRDLLTVSTDHKLQEIAQNVQQQQALLLQYGQDLTAHHSYLMNFSDETNSRFFNLSNLAVKSFNALETRIEGVSLSHDFLLNSLENQKRVLDGYEGLTNKINENLTLEDIKFRKLHSIFRKFPERPFVPSIMFTIKKNSESWVKC